MRLRRANFTVDLGKARSTATFLTTMVAGVGAIRNVAVIVSSALRIASRVRRSEFCCAAYAGCKSTVVTLAGIKSPLNGYPVVEAGRHSKSASPYNSAVACCEIDWSLPFEDRLHPLSCFALQLGHNVAIRIHSQRDLGVTEYLHYDAR